MKTSSEVKDGLVAVLKKIKVASGFTNDLPDDHIYGYYNADLINSTVDDLYPKCCVFILRGSNERQVGQNEVRHLSLGVLIIVKAATPELASDLLQTFLNDLEKVIYENENLNQTVISADLVRFALDDGALRDEGALVAEVQTERMRH